MARSDSILLLYGPTFRGSKSAQREAQVERNARYGDLIWFNALKGHALHSVEKLQCLQPPWTGPTSLRENFVLIFTIKNEFQLNMYTPTNILILSNQCPLQYKFLKL